MNLRESVEIYSMMCVILMMFQFVENWFSMAEVEMFRFINELYFNRRVALTLDIYFD